MWRENGLLNIVIVKLVPSAVVCVSLPGATPPRGGGGLELIFAGYVPLAS